MLADHPSAPIAPGLTLPAPTVQAVRVWLTPPDRQRCRWRIEIWPDGRVLVWRLSDHWVASAPQRWPRDLGELGEWLVEREIDPIDLIQA